MCCVCVSPVGQRLRVVCSHVRRCGGCPRNGNQAATSPPTIHQTTRRPWSFSVTLTTRPTAARPGTPHATRYRFSPAASPFSSLFPSFAILLVMAFISISLSLCLALSPSLAAFWLCLPSIYCSVLFLMLQKSICTVFHAPIRSVLFSTSAYFFCLRPARFISCTIIQNTE